MPGTFSQIYIQIVFAVKGRQNLLHQNWRNDVFKYIAGIIEANDQKSIIVNGVSDHVHVFVGLRPSMSVSDLVRDIKSNSSKFINDRRLVAGQFTWQEGYGAFSYAHSQLDAVYNYILNQDSHHRARSFKEEYLEMLHKFGVPYQEQYLFDWLE